ncbi:MAG TPA: hypothetical protein DEB06_06475 [Phycisphaerales bacterium]|nr:hypothetical protein [Phycisphaerales bacterium]
MRIALLRTVAPSVAALTLAVAGITFAQSGTSPSGTPTPTRQPGSDTQPSGTQKAEARAPKAIVLAFHADWCGKCKVLGPKLMDEVRPAVASDPVLFVKVDLTNKDDSSQAEYLMSALGCGELWKEHGGKTGFALVVDPKTRKVISTLKSDQDASAMKKALASAIKG